MSKGTSQAEATLSSEKIKPVALEFGISQSVKNSI